MTASRRAFSHCKRTTDGGRRTRSNRLRLEPLEPRLVLDGNSLLISEFMANNDTTLADGDGNFSDWIEIHNPTGSDVVLDGWYLTDDVTDLKRWQFPDDQPQPETTLIAGGYLVVFATSGREDVSNPTNPSLDPAGNLHTNFKLKKDEGEYLALVRNDGLTIEHEYAPLYPPQHDDVSYGLASDLVTQGYFLEPTPREPNTGQPVDDPTHAVVITEIMYNPNPETYAPDTRIAREEYIELYNRGIEPINLAGWQITEGVQFTFPDVTLNSGEYLVVAADVDAFAAAYPNVPVGTRIVGGWIGRLSNSGEEIELLDDIGRRMDRVAYSDQGDWSVREVREADEWGHRGWIWAEDHDGLGKSLELTTMALSNEYGQLWAASQSDGGTPGEPNSVADVDNDVAPLILDVSHFPVIGQPGEPVTVTAELKDETAAGITATVYYRVDGAPGFSAAVMTEDALAGGGIYHASLPGRADGTIVEFYVSAADAAANTRTWPAPARTWPAPGDPGYANVANLLYQVDGGFDPNAEWVPGSHPIYYMIMTGAEAAELKDIGDDGDPFWGEGRSDAQMNATLISVDGTGARVRYNVGVRNRGNRTRVDPPNNYRVNFVHDAPWKGVTAININSKYPFSQVIGSAVHRMAGTAAPEATAIKLRVNGQDLANAGSGDGMYGLYAAVEVYNSEWADNHWPDDNQGNLYRLSYYEPRSGSRTFADLDYKGPAPYDNPDDYRDNYRKQTNESEDDWSDVFELIDKLNNPNISDDEFVAEVGRVIDVEQWMRYLATDALLGNREGGLYEGEGDDFAMYRGVTDPRFRLLPHDLDTLLGQGDHNSEPHRNIWDYDGARVGGLHRLLNHPETVGIYLRQYMDLIETVFAPENFNPLIDRVLAGVTSQATINAMKNFVVARNAGVLAQFQQEFTVQSDLPVLNGYPRTNGPNTSLHGTAHAAYTRSVLVNGEPADWDPRAGQWEITTTGGGGSPGTVLPFQNGVSPDGTYAGTSDTELRSGGTLHPEQQIQVDQSSSGNLLQALLRFDNIFGSEQGQIALDADIAGATLVLNVTDEGDPLALHRMLQPWDEAANWSTLGGNGIQNDGVEAVVQADAVSSQAGVGTLSIDVTSSILAWQADPSGNYGWAILPTGDNGVFFDSSEATSLTNRPELRITLNDGTSAGTGGVGLNPGINRVTVETFDGPDGTGDRLEHDFIDIWYDAPAGGGGTPLPTPPPSPEAQGDLHLNLVTRDSYLPGVPFLVRAEVLDENFRIDRSLWDGLVTLESDNPAVSLSTDRITLYNGLGSVLVTAAGSGDFTLTATLDGMEAGRRLVSLEGTAMAEISGTLSSPDHTTTLSGVVHVTGGLTVPDGHTLVIEPGTLVLVDGVASGSGGTVITVAGDVQSLGTEARPVTITAYTAGENWGEIFHNSAEPSVYRYTNITQGGHSTAREHSNTGPTIRTSGGSSINFDHANLTDLAGKVMYGPGGGNLIFHSVHMGRAVMGPEIWPDTLLIVDTWLTDMHHNDDADGIYIHDTDAGTALMTGGVSAVIDDDGIDTLSAVLTVEDWIIRDCNDKGASIYDGEVWLSYCLIVDNAKFPEDGIAASVASKGYVNDPVTVHMDHTTIVATPLAGPDVDVGIWGWDKYGRDNVPTIFHITNSIVVAADPITTDYDPADIHVDHSNLFSETWPGEGNIDGDPLFVDRAGHDYHLRPGSPSVDAGDPNSLPDEDLSRADQGYYGGRLAATMAPQTLPATIDENMILTAGGGPYRVNVDVTVIPGAALIVRPGTTVFFAAGA
ncbi:MAG TPA: lamin tail domain-containing protein, partial [Thermoguttaceae bacterium]|nr:lamin tail domain-containing protein [Thermoguttaceae bacterium]